MTDEVKKRGRKPGQTTGPRSVFWVLSSNTNCIQVESSINDDYEKSQEQAISFFKEKFKMDPMTILGPYHHFKGMKPQNNKTTQTIENQDIVFSDIKEEIELDGKTFVGLKGKVSATGKNVMLIEPKDSVGSARIISI
jgi:hypothetical protein